MTSTEPPPSRSGVARPSLSVSMTIWFMAAAYLAAHAPFLAPTPYDLDAVNFALALHEYDLTKHQPHAPGSPLFVGLGRVAYEVLAWYDPTTMPDASQRRVEAAALAIWSAAFGALAAIGLFRFFAAVGLSALRSVLATAASLSCPLFWFSGIRPLSDVSGLAVSALALGLIAPRLARVPAGAEPPGSGAAFVLGCFVAGLAPGMRVQMAWLVWPVTAVAIVASARRRPALAVYACAAVAAGAAAWMIPLSLLAGGPGEYLRVLGLQAGDDFGAGQMLAVSFSVRALTQAAYDTLIAPWGAAWLGGIALAAATVGAGRIALRQPRLAVMLVVIFGPYALLHLGFHDTAHIRYALPLVPLIGLLAVEGFNVFGRRAGAAGTAVLVAASLMLATTAVVAHSKTAAPAFQALDDIRRELTAAPGERPLVAMHHAVQRALRGERLETRTLPAPPRYEWLELARYWAEGGRAPVWFLANRRRTDLALIDPASRVIRQSYSVPATSRPLLAGVRPRGVQWVAIAPPGWVALEGWALTPEVRGVSARAAQRNRKAHTTALVRRRAEEATLLLGGRNLGGPCATGATVAVDLDGREIERFSLAAGESFTHLWRLPAGALTGQGPFAELQLRVADRGGVGQMVDVAFEQFDVQSSGGTVAGFAEGWFEPEFDERAGAGFRWMSDRAAMRIESFDHDVVVRLRGESPGRYFAEATELIVRVAGRVVDTRRLADDFDIATVVPAALLRAAGGVVEFEASQAFVPDERSGNGDRRALALRMYEAVATIPNRRAN